MAVIDRRDPDAVSNDTRPPGMSRHRKALTAGSLFAAIWLVALAANAVRVDWILPIILLLGTASLLRVGHALLDRLIIAGFVLAGLLIVEGVLFSFWPWGIEPVPVTGLTGSLLLAIGGIRHLRSAWRPSLPRRVRGTDLIVLSAPVAAWLTVRRPLDGKGFLDLLPYEVSTQDRTVHFAIFDAVLRTGAYPFLRPKQAHPFLPRTGYPPGAHYLYALLDTFRRSSTDPGNPIREFLRFYQYEALGISLLALAITWSARWVAGPAATGWRRAVLCVVVAVFASIGPLSGLFWQAFDAEVIGLVALAGLSAILIRAPRAPHEQILVTSLLLITVVFAYSMFVAVAGAATLFAAVIYRNRLRHVAVFASGAALATAVLILLPVLQSLRVPNLTHIFSVGAATLQLDPLVSGIFIVAALSPALSKSGRRTPTWQLSASATAIAMALAGATVAIGTVTTGSPQYYSSKFVAAGFVVALCGCGGAFVAIKPSPVLTSSMLLLLLVPHGYPSAFVTSLDEWRSKPSLLRSYSTVARFGDGTPTIFATGASGQRNRELTAFIAALNHDLGTIDADALAPEIEPPTEPAAVVKGVGSALKAQDESASAVIGNWLRHRPPGERLAVTDSWFAGLLSRLASEEPDLRLSVLLVPPSSR